MNLLIFQTGSVNLLLGAVPETLGLLIFGVGLLFFAIGLRWILSREEKNESRKFSANIHRTSH